MSTNRRLFIRNVAASWSVIAPLSEASIKNKSRTIDIPDFTRGGWKLNTPHDLTLNGGGNTSVKQIVN